MMGNKIKYYNHKNNSWNIFKISRFSRLKANWLVLLLYPKTWIQNLKYKDSDNTYKSFNHQPESVRTSLVVQTAKNPPAVRENWVWSLGWEDALEEGMVLCFPNGSLVKSPPMMWETWVQSLGWEDPLEKGTATHSSILAWKISRTV